MVRKSMLILAALAASTPTFAAWYEARSAHFIIYSEDKPETVKEFATELERFDAAMRVMRGLEPTIDSPNNRLTVFQLSSIGAVQRLIGGRSKGVAGAYKARAGDTIALVPRRAGNGEIGDLDARTILFHEYAHHFMYRNYPAAFPAWFTEGYAEFASTARFGTDGSVDLGLAATHRAAGLFLGPPLSINILMQPETKKLTPEQHDVFYGRAWLLTHYLTVSPERDGQLGRYLRAINTGKSSIAAASEAFGDLGKLDRDIDRYKSARRLTIFRVGADKIKTAPIEVRELSAGAGAIMPVMIRSRHGLDEASAQLVVKEARSIAASYPDDPFVQLALAEAEMDAGDLDASERAAEKVLAVEPNNVRALIFKGRVAIGRLRASSGSTPKEWQQARRWFVKANRAEPEAPMPLIAFYTSFLAEGVSPNPNAVAGLDTAAMLAPEDIDLRVMLARQLLVDGEAGKARRALAPAAFYPHGGPRSEFASRVIAAIDEGGAAAGLKAWTSLPEEAKTASAK